MPGSKVADITPERVRFPGLPAIGTRGGNAGACPSCGQGRRCGFGTRDRCVTRPHAVRAIHAIRSYLQSGQTV